MPSAKPNQKKAFREFREKISRALVDIPDQLGQGDFLPDRKFPKLVTKDEVSLLLSGAPPELVDFVCRPARKVFLTIGMCCDPSDDLLSIMKTCQKLGMTDDHLPIDNITKDGTCQHQTYNCEVEPGEDCTHDKALDMFHDDPWDVTTVNSFFKQQWSFCSPVFTSDSQPKLEANCRLPFTWADNIPNEGHFSTVIHAKLHADHHPDGWDLTEGGQRELHVALKKLKSLPPDSNPGYNVEKAWEHEATALHQISGLRHKNLIRLIAAFKRGTEHFIMFEWADGGTLRDIWQRERTEGGNLDGDRIIGVLEQLVGLAGALSKLHNTNTKTKTAKITSAANKGVLTGTKVGSKTRSKTIFSPPADDFDPGSLRVPPVRFQNYSSDDDYYTSDDIVDAQEEHWRHGDLKPDNILRFKGLTSGWLGTLKIADLGLAKRHFFDTLRRDEETKQKYTTLQYEAPEAISNRNLRVGRSRRYDIWSMGCIILEFVIVLLYGYEGLEAFYEERNYIDTSTETLYFTANKNKRTAQVSDIATSWMEQILQNDPECNSSPSGSAIRDLVKLVKNRLLVVALPQDGMDLKDLEECRADADELEKALDSIWKRAVDDETTGGRYFFTGLSRAGVQTPQQLKGGRRTSSLLTSASQHRPSGGINRNLEVRTPARNMAT